MITRRSFWSFLGGALSLPFLSKRSIASPYLIRPPEGMRFVPLYGKDFTVAKSWCEALDVGIFADFPGLIHFRSSSSTGEITRVCDEKEAAEDRKSLRIRNLVNIKSRPDDIR